MSQNKSLSTQEVAQILHVSKSTIYDLIRKGEIHSYKIGRKVRVTQDDVDAYIARSRHEHSTRPVKNIDTHSTLLTPRKEDQPELILSGQDVVVHVCLCVGTHSEGSPLVMPRADLCVGGRQIVVEGIKAPRGRRPLRPFLRSASRGRREEPPRFSFTTARIFLPG